MSAAYLYSVIGILIIILAIILVRHGYEGATAEIEVERDYAQDRWDGECLSLAERIFDPADYLWLRDELGFPQLARALARSRKQLALRWLKALRRSFDELVRVPEPVRAEGSTNGASATWQLLWLTLRFHLLLSYALLVVRIFGPYYSLLPSLGWMHSLSLSGDRKEHYRTTSDIS